MISLEILIKLARKWRKLARISRARITFRVVDPSLSKIEKGHFVVYTADQKRYEVPLAYLSNKIFKELSDLAEDEFGHSSDGPISLPCDSVFMEYAMALIRRRVSKDLEKALVVIMMSERCFSNSYLQQGPNCQQIGVCSF